MLRSAFNLVRDRLVFELGFGPAVLFYTGKVYGRQLRCIVTLVYGVIVSIRRRVECAEILMMCSKVRLWKLVLQKHVSSP